MRVSSMQDKLARGLSLVGRAVASRSTLPVLSNVYIGTEKGMLKLAATNLEIGITTWVEAKVEEPGSTTVPAKLFSDLVNQSPPERIQLDLTERNQELHYRCASVDATIKGIDASEFPIIPTAEEGATIRVPAPLLKEMIEQVSFAAAVDESRPILTGVLMDIQENRLTMAAADGFRLSVRSAHLEQDVPQPTHVIVPARALSELARVIGDSEEEVKIIVTTNRNQLLFHLDHVDLVTQLIEGNFPDVQRLIPTSSNTRTVVDTAQLLKAVRRAYIFARDAANIIRVQISDTEPGTPGQLTLTAEATEVGENIEELVAAIEGEGMEIAFNAKYLMDVLTVLNTAQVAIETNSSSTPGVIRPVGSDGFTHVIMPMHIGSGR
ncbi:MAG: DNA polymerase III subunit beta [Chloroflexota bacterium]|nr:DNA polymerase III subunit beta [Chloroflexota bacterium]